MGLLTKLTLLSFFHDCIDCDCVVAVVVVVSGFGSDVRCSFDGFVDRGDFDCKLQARKKESFRRGSLDLILKFERT